MNKSQKWYLLILGGLLLTLGGLGWDGYIHAHEHAHLVVEELFNPGNPFENPAHAAIGIGLVWTTLAALAGFTLTWLEGKEWHRQLKSLSMPILLWLVMGAAGALALATLAQTP